MEATMTLVRLGHVLDEPPGWSLMTPRSGVQLTVNLGPLWVAIAAGCTRGLVPVCALHVRHSRSDTDLVGRRLERGREAFREGRWADAYRLLIASTADERTPVDCERLAVSAYLVGRDDESATAWEFAFRGHLEAGEPAQAAGCAFWLAFGLLMRGHPAEANGWFSRTRTTIEESRVDCAATGYLLVADLIRALGSGRAATAQDMAAQAVGIGLRFGDPDLQALGTLGHGQALLALGDAKGGTVRLDEVMLSVETGEVGPVTSGIVYCAVILECMAMFDLPRATEWTRALSAWCDAQPDLVPYRGQCLVHRSQVEQAAGDWSRAIDTARAACAAAQRSAAPGARARPLPGGRAAPASRRLRRRRARLPVASQNGNDPMPGLALLELAARRRKRRHRSHRPCPGRGRCRHQPSRPPRRRR